MQELEELERRVRMDPEDIDAAFKLQVLLRRSSTQVSCDKFQGNRESKYNYDIDKDVPEEIQGYSWHEAFGYAGEKDTCAINFQGGYHLAAAFPGCPVSLEPFSRKDVCHLEYVFEGKNDGPDWIAIGHLKDGRWFRLSAGCDYTGWD